jgi:MFS family permease
MVSRDDLMNAISLNSAMFNASRVVGPGVAAVLIALMGIPPLFLLNAISYVAVIAGLLLMDPARLFTHPVRRMGTERPLRQVREGIEFAWRTPPIRLALIVLLFVSTFGMNFNIILPLLADFVYRSGASGYGLLSSVMGAGSLVAALLLASLVKRPNINLLVGAAAGFSVLLLVLAVTRTQSMAYVVVLLIGLASIAFTATSNTLLQTSAPDHMRGRVMGLYAMVFAGTTPIGALFTGVFARWLGAPGALIIVAIPCLLAVGYGWMARRPALDAQAQLLSETQRARTRLEGVLATPAAAEVASPFEEPTAGMLLQEPVVAD